VPVSTKSLLPISGASSLASFVMALTDYLGFPWYPTTSFVKKIAVDPTAFRRRGGRN
jgi:hypothetical protein